VLTQHLVEDVAPRCGAAAPLLRAADTSHIECPWSGSAGRHPPREQRCRGKCAVQVGTKRRERTHASRRVTHTQVWRRDVHCRGHPLPGR
jgi:hypothetical protein